MSRFEYIHIKLSDIRQEIILQYQWHDIAQNRYMYVELQKGIFILPQASILAHELLVKLLAKHGYEPRPATTGLWRHANRSIAFVITVNNFGKKYVGK